MKALILFVITTTCTMSACKQQQELVNVTPSIKEITDFGLRMQAAQTQDYQKLQPRAKFGHPAISQDSISIITAFASSGPLPGFHMLPKYVSQTPIAEAMSSYTEFKQKHAAHPGIVFFTQAYGHGLITQYAMLGKPNCASHVLTIYKALAQTKYEGFALLAACRKYLGDHTDTKDLIRTDAAIAAYAKVVDVGEVAEPEKLSKHVLQVMQKRKEQLVKDNSAAELYTQLVTVKK